MKKIVISLISAIAMLMSTVSYATEVKQHEETNNVYISGIAKTDGAITLLVKDENDNIEYMNQKKHDADGNFDFKFKLPGDKVYSTYVRDSDDQPIMYNMETTTTAKKCSASLSLSHEGDEIRAVGRIDNIYDDLGNCQLFMAFYDDNKKLLGVEKSDVGYGYEEGKIDVAKSIPEACEFVKAFVWSGIDGMIPFCGYSIKPMKHINVIFIGDSLGQTYSEGDVRKGWGQYLDSYFIEEATVNNLCHAGWNTNTYIMLDETTDQLGNGHSGNGWEYAKTQFGSGDYVIFALGYNDWCCMGIDGDYYEMVDGKKKYYKTGTPYLSWYVPDNEFVTQTDDGGEYIQTQKHGKVYTKNLSCVFKQDNGEYMSYGALDYRENMKKMLDDCKEIGANAIVRTIAGYSEGNLDEKISADSGVSVTVSHARVNEFAMSFEKEYDNVMSIDFYKITGQHFKELYNSFSDNLADMPSSYFDEEGNLQPWIDKDLKLQQLRDKYWITIQSIKEHFNNAGEVVLDSNGKYVFKSAADGNLYGQDSLHYGMRGAQYIAEETAKAIKNSSNKLADYIDLNLK